MRMTEREVQALIRAGGAVGKSLERALASQGLAGQKIEVASRQFGRAAAMPQDALGAFLESAFTGVFIRDYLGAIPGRKFQIDFASVANKLAIELDGWQFHGKHKAGFHRDREKDRLLTLNGWRILRFTAKDVRGDLELVRDQVGAMLRLTSQAPVSQDPTQPDQVQAHA